ncbi:hypothetical protein O6H91_03G132700 [Diphasiastrum complanatum]|uniref:Uncharacterized protein n=1 Tax=Diphasiastrum complanatum TaxID=34168 RepID=A0ACC2EBT0_DIPCM|nr:hypothetical protein O6H91_03G132700 [Diphasiastrum complanatum]
MGQNPEAANAAMRMEDGPDTSGSVSIAWGTGEELLLACAVERYGRTNWDRVAAELQSRPALLSLPPSQFTAETCKFKFYALEGKYTSTTSEAKQHGESLPWIEQLRQKRIAYLKYQIEIREMSMNLRQEKLKRLKAERDKELLAKKAATFSVRNASPASLSKPSDVVSGTASLPSYHEDPEKAIHNSDLHNVCNDDFLPNDLGRKSMDGKESQLQAVSEISVNEHNSFPVDSTAAVDGEAVRCLGLDKNKGSNPNSTSAAARNTVDIITEEKQSRKENENPVNCINGQDVMHKEFIHKDNCAPEGLDKPDVGQHSPSNILVVKSQEQRGATRPEQSVSKAKNVESFDVKLGEMLPCSAKVHDACNELDDEKAKNILIDEHQPNKVHSDNTELHETDCESIPIEAKRCAVDDDISKTSFQSQKKLDAKGRFGALEENSSMECRPRVGGNVNDSLDKHYQEETSTSVNISALSSPLSELVSSSKMAHVPVVENEAVDEKASPVETSQPQCTAGTSSPEGSVSPSKDVDKVTSKSVEQQTDTQRTVGHDAPEMGDISSRPPVALNTVEQKSASGCGEIYDSGKPHEENAKSKESSKRGELTEKLREVNNSLQVSTTPFNQEIASKYISEEDIVNEKVFQREKFETVPPVSRLASHTIEEKSYKYRNREGSDESEQAFACSLGEAAVDGARLRGGAHDLETADVGDIGHEKKAETERHDDDTTTSPASLDHSLAALDSKVSSMSHEGSGSAQEHSKDADGQQAARDYGDSQAEKSEVGSPADGIDDTSLTSKRNRREPRVPGKLQPLLECLRLICAHKFAPLFKQKQESQDNHQYDLLIRRHMDLGMIRARLEEGAYSGSLEFFRDLLLIFQNALVYFPKDSQEYGAANVLRKYGMEEMDKIFRTEASLKQDRPATRRRDSRKSFDLSKQARTAGPTLIESRKRERPRLSATTDFTYSEPVLESEGKSKSVSLSMGGPSSRGDEADISQLGDQEVDGRFGGIPIKPTKFTSQSVGREESQTLQELKYHTRGPIKEEPREFEKGTSKRPIKGLEYTTSSGDAPESEKKAVKLRSSLKGARSKDFTSKTSKISMIPQSTTGEEIAIQNPVRASRSLKQAGLQLKEVDKYNSIKKRVKR